MSYDLYFYQQKGRAIPESELISFLKKNSNFRMYENSRGSEYRYYNSDTGVYFTLDVSNKFDPAEDIEAFRDFQSVNLSFNLNYCRPDFFAHEALMVVETLCKRFGFFTYDPQRAEEIAKFNKELLFKSWQSGNQLAANVADNPLYMAAEKSNYYWRYMFERSNIEQELDEHDIFVPSMLILRNKLTNQLYTAITWVDGIPIAMPKVDYFIVSRNGRQGEESCLVRYSDMMAEVGDMLENLDRKIEDLKLMTSENAYNAREKLRNLRVSGSVQEVVEAVAPEKFINVDVTAKRMVQNN